MAATEMAIVRCRGGEVATATLTGAVDSNAVVSAALTLAPLRVRRGRNKPENHDGGFATARMRFLQLRRTQASLAWPYISFRAVNSTSLQRVKLRAVADRSQTHRKRAAPFIDSLAEAAHSPSGQVLPTPAPLTMLNIQLPEHSTVKGDNGGSSPSSPSQAPQADGERDLAAFLEIGSPYGFKHDVHIHYNFQEARFEGIPDNFADYLVSGTSERHRADTVSVLDAAASPVLKSDRRTKRIRTSSAPPGSLSLSNMIASLDPVDSNDPVRILNQHFKLPFRQVPRVAVPGYDERVPAVLVMLQQHFIGKQGYLTPHIFRESPSKAERDQAMRDINCGAFRGAKHDVRVLADLIKLWFRELPMPILHEIPAGEMERLAAADNVEFEVLSLLGDLERTIVLWLADLLAYVAEYQPHNHMGVDQLAIVIAPNLVRLETENPMVAVALSKAAVDLFRGVLRARFQRRHELKAAGIALNNGPETPMEA